MSFPLTPYTHTCVPAVEYRTVSYNSCLSSVGSLLYGWQQGSNKGSGKRIKSKRKKGKAKSQANDSVQEASADVGILKDKIKARGLTLSALNMVKRWGYKKGSVESDEYVKIWVEEKDRILFTSGIHNRIVSSLRKEYGTVVLLKYAVIDSDGKMRNESD